MADDGGELKDYEEPSRENAGKVKDDSNSFYSRASVVDRV